MGWPKKDEVLRIYRDKDKQSYILMFVDNLSTNGRFDCIANIYHEPTPPSLCGCGITRSYIADNWLKRMQWDELPSEWQEAFSRYMRQGGESFDPAHYRGLWRVGRP